jgi:hypothetical protein
MIAKDGKFGRDYYQLLSSAKVVLNGAIDVSGEDRGNMRCFEAMGAGSLLLSDQGNYPDGMIDGRTIMTYRSPEHAVHQVRTMIEATNERMSIARGSRDGLDSLFKRDSVEAFRGDSGLDLGNQTCSKGILRTSFHCCS